MARSPLPVPGPNDLWGQQLNDAIETTGFDDMADFDTSGGVADGAAPRYSVADEKWYPEVSPDMARFRGDWQDPANTLLWSTDFSDPTHAPLLGGYAGVNPGTSSPLTNAVKSATSSQPPAPSGFPWCASYTASTSSNPAVLILDLALLPETVGKYVSRVEFLSPPFGHTTSETIYSGGLLLSTTQGVVGTHDLGWNARSVPVGAVNSNVRYAHRKTTAGAGDRSPAMAKLMVYGAADSADLYQMGDTVVHGGVYYRSLFDNNDHPPTDPSFWQLIPYPARTLSAKLENLLDVSTYGRADQSYLQWDATTQLYRHVMAPDYLNFKGDWQDPANALLWSTDFSSPGDSSLLVAEDTFAFFGRSTPPSAYGTLPPYSWVFRMQQAGTSPQMGRARLDLGALGLSSRYLSRLKMYYSGRNSTAGATPNSVGLLINNTNRSGSSALGSSAPNWALVTAPILSAVSSLHLYVENGNTAHTRTAEFTGLELYGALDNADLYQINDVVSHAGVFYRSLYDNNTEEPGTGPKWYPIPALTP